MFGDQRKEIATILNYMQKKPFTVDASIFEILHVKMPASRMWYGVSPIRLVDHDQKTGFPQVIVLFCRPH